MGVIKLGVKQQTFPEVALLVHCLQIKLEFYITVFVEVGKPENAENNPTKQRQEPTTNSMSTHSARIESLPQRWEASTLATSPLLLLLPRQE